jgi:hypothetical protein
MRNSQKWMRDGHDKRLLVQISKKRTRQLVNAAESGKPHLSRVFQKKKSDRFYRAVGKSDTQGHKRKFISTNQPPV